MHEGHWAEGGRAILGVVGDAHSTCRGPAAEFLLIVSVWNTSPALSDLLIFFFFSFLFWPRCAACGTLVP